MLLSSPGLEEFYRHCLLYIEDPGGQRETPEHPTKLIKVRLILLGLEVALEVYVLLAPA